VTENENRKMKNPCFQILKEERENLKTFVGLTTKEKREN